MIKLTKDTTNSDIALTLGEYNDFVVSGEYLFEFVNDTTSTAYYVISDDTATGVEVVRFNKFEIIEGADDPVNGSIILGEEGFYTYSVYLNTVPDNLDPTGLTSLEDGKLRLEGTAQSFTKHSISTTFIAHDPTT